MEAYAWLKSLFDSNFFSALVGAGIGGYFTSKATIRAHRLEKSAADLEGLAETMRLLTLIQVELKSAWDIFNKEYAPGLLALPSGKPYITVWPIGEDSFVIYNSTPQCLANISPELAIQIVQAYMRIKGMVAMIEENNRYAEAASQSGLQRIDSMLATFFESGRELNEEDAARAQSFLEQYTEWQAIKIGMGQHADSLKLFTQELSKMLNLVFSGIQEELDCLEKKLSKRKSHI